MISSAVPACRRAGMLTLQIIIHKKMDKINPSINFTQGLILSGFSQDPIWGVSFKLPKDQMKFIVGHKVL